MSALVLSAGASAGLVATDVQRFSDVVAPHVPGQLLVGLRGDVSVVSARQLHRSTVGARGIQRLVHLVKCRRDSHSAKVIARYESDPRVWYAEPNFLRERYLTPNDPLFPQLWGLHNTGQGHRMSDDPPPDPVLGSNDRDMDVVNAWDKPTAFGANTIVAVIDDGVQVSHADLTGRFWINPVRDQRRTGSTTTATARSTTSGAGTSRKTTTRLAPEGVPGGNDHGRRLRHHRRRREQRNRRRRRLPELRIMGLKVMSDDGAISASIIAALKYAKAKGAKVVNMSLGGPGFSISPGTRS